MPEGDHFLLSTRVPVKQLGEGAIAVTAHLKGGQPHIEVVTKSEGRPMEQLEDLDKAYLHHGQVFVK